MNDDQVRTEIIKILEQDTSMTRTAAAGFSNVGTTAFSLWLNESYKGDNSKITRSVAAFIERYKERKKWEWIKVPFIETVVAQRIFEIAKICSIEHEMGVVVGNSGVGKTIAAKRYAEKNAGVILLEVNFAYTPRVLFNHIATAMDIPLKRNMDALFEAVIGGTMNNDVLIIIDEAEHLPYRSLEFLRRLYDHGNVGILLVGMPRLIDNLRGYNEEFKQLYSRVGIYSKLTRMDKSDTELVVKKALGDDKVGLIDVLYRESKANMRQLVKLLKRSLRVAAINNTQISKEIIGESAKTLII